MAGDALVDAVVFDMGGVVVRLAPLEDVLAGVELPRDELWERWILSDAVRALEGGTCGIDEFAVRLVADLGVALSPEVLVERFHRFPLGLYPGAAELLAQTRTRCTTAILSNTNDLHWTSQPDHELLHQAFDREYLSYRLGLLKPDEAIYRHVIADLALPPERIVFLDDNMVNVAGAHAVGIRAHQVRGPAEARSVLEALGVLVDPDQTGDDAVRPTAPC